VAEAESWYTKLLGRGPDYRPMKTLIQWDLFAQGGLQLATDDNLAANGALFLIVRDIATERQRLRDLGIAIEAIRVVTAMAPLFGYNNHGFMCHLCRIN
jgi:hypothetical protein